jgi:predicted deacylase
MDVNVTPNPSAEDHTNRLGFVSQFALTNDLESTLSDGQLLHEFVQCHKGQLKTYVPEYLELDKIISQNQDVIEVELLAEIPVNNIQLPIPMLTIGSPQTSQTTFFISAAIHGVERIGTQALLAWLQSLLQRYRWDGLWRSQFETDVALVILPMVNPAGMYLNTRANANGIDINRHAPIEAEDPVPFLLGGQRFSKKLPWYRGKQGGAVQTEFAVLEQVIERITSKDKPVIALDIHSGFGFKDQLWIPYAFRRQPISDVPVYMALKILWERNYPNHNYLFEPQSTAYLSHGDVWDYFHRQCQEQGRTLLPITLEMGSWNWVKKRPIQLLSFSGLFHPTVPHRHARVLRQHLGLMDFLLAATRNYDQWKPQGDQWYAMEQVALSMWYQD